MTYTSYLKLALNILLSIWRKKLSKLAFTHEVSWLLFLIEDIDKKLDVIALNGEPWLDKARQNIVLQCSGFQRVNNLRAVGQKLGYDTQFMHCTVY